MIGPIRRAAGITFVAVVPWLLAVAGFTLAAVGWIRDEERAATAPAGESLGGTELKKLRLAIATANSENDALRQELDRMVAHARSEGAAAKTPAAATTAAEGEPVEGSEAMKELGSRLQQSISLASAGDQNAAREAATAMMDILKTGPEAFGVLRDTYLATADPKGRMMLLPTILFAGGKDARDFVVAQVKVESDAELKRALLGHAANFATPDVAPVLQETFLDALKSDGEPSARVAAIRGLRYARIPSVDEALLAAASDASEEVRLAAIENLAARPGLRDQLRAIVDAESSARVRDVAECRLLIAENGG